MRSEQPHGARSCGRGGSWSHALDVNEMPHLGLELSTVLAECVGDVQKVNLKAEVFEKMHAATRGDLTLVTTTPDGVRAGDVDFMECTSCVLEIRLDSHTGEDEPDEGADDAIDDRAGRRLVRLYFAEPEKDPGVLLSLLMHSKAPGPYGLDEQTTAAKAADRRAEEHYNPLLRG